DLGRRVLQREEDVARGRGLEVAHLSAHEDAAEQWVRADRLAHESGELRDRDRRRHARPRFPGDGDRVHHRETQTRRYEWMLGEGGGRARNAVYNRVRRSFEGGSAWRRKMI